MIVLLGLLIAAFIVAFLLNARGRGDADPRRQEDDRRTERRMQLVLAVVGIVAAVAAAVGLGTDAIGFVLPIAVVVVGAIVAYRLLLLREKLLARPPRTRVGRLYRRWRARRRRGLVFLAFFLFLTVSILGWLFAGLGVLVARTYPSVHEALHRFGGAEHTTRIVAREFEFDRAEVTVRAGEPTRVVFEVPSFGPDRGTAPRNFVIYADAGGTDELFRSGTVTPPAVDEYGEVDDHDEEREFEDSMLFRHYTIRIDEPGIYPIVCDVCVNRMSGQVRVLAEGQGPTLDHFEQGSLWTHGRNEIARRMAEAVHRSGRGWQIVLDYVFSFLNVGLAIFLIRLRPRDLVARCFAVAMLGSAAAFNFQSHAAASSAGFFAGLHDFIHPFSGVPYVYALLLFPDGALVPRFPPGAVRVVYRTLLFFAIVIVLGATGVLDAEPGPAHAFAQVQLFGLVIPLVGMVAQGYRLRRARTPTEVQQSKLLLWAVAPAFFTGLALIGLLDIPFFNTQPGYWATFDANQGLAFRAFQPVFAVIPVALFVGILRYRLFDLDVVIRKTIVFGALAVMIAAAYVGVVVALSEAFPTSSTAASIVALVAIAVAAQPARERLQRFANRLVYGARATPYEIMADFSHSMSGAFSAKEVLPRIAEAAAWAVHATHTRVCLFLPDGGRRTISYPLGVVDDEFDRTVAVVHLGEPVGEISVAKAPGDPVTHADEALLDGLAAQAGLALYNVRLTEQLQARLEELSEQARQIGGSRQRLVTAHHAEHRRLERAIDEQVERQLTQIASALSVAEERMAADPHYASEMLGAIKAQASAALEALRELARGVFPPLLADRGLFAALEAHIRKAELPVDITSDESLPGVRFDQHVEAAVYFCCVEALSNSARYAPGSRITLELSADQGWLSFSVRDDGPGFDAATIRPDSDLQDMTDRVEALGGVLEIRTAPGAGTTIAGRVPVVAVETIDVAPAGA